MAGVQGLAKPISRPSRHGTPLRSTSAPLRLWAAKSTEPRGRLPCADASASIRRRAGTPGRYRRSTRARPRQWPWPRQEMPTGGCSRASSRARTRACGSARSRIQPCSPHSRIAPTSIRTDVAHPSAVRKAGRRSFIVSIEFARETNPLGRPPFRAANTGQGFGIAGTTFSTRVSTSELCCCHELEAYTFGRMYSARTGQARLGYRPSRKSIKRMVEKVHALTDRTRTWQETTKLVGKVNRTLRG